MPNEEEDRGAGDPLEGGESAQPVGSEDVEGAAEGEQGVEGAEGEGGGDESKRPITDEDRQRHPNIPAKFKYWDDVVSWGSEAEKAKSRAESEKGSFSDRLRQLESQIEAKREREGRVGDEINPEELKRIKAKFAEDLGEDAHGAIQKMFSDFERRLEDKAGRKDRDAKWKAEEDEFRKDPDYKERWDSEIKPALIKIAQEKPYLQSIAEVLAIYERQKGREERANGDEAQRKKDERKGAHVEHGAGTKVSQNLADKISGAKSLDELDKLAPYVK